MKDIVMLVAHPDDEVIFGWPVLARAKAIICCSSDEFNPERVWCKDRIKAFKDICGLLDIRGVCYSYNSEFYKMDARAGELLKFQDEIGRYLYEGPIFTHNRWGEYGHMDHILVHQVALASKQRILTTDMCIDAGWLNCRPAPAGEKLEDCEIDMDLYLRCKAIYDKYGCWTWSKDPISKAGLYAGD
jgi:hypothetical protein